MGTCPENADTLLHYNIYNSQKYFQSARRAKLHNNTAMASMSILVACLSTLITSVMRPWNENGGREYSTKATSSS
jgi:hypothetical protein